MIIPSMGLQGAAVTEGSDNAFFCFGPFPRGTRLIALVVVAGRRVLTDAASLTLRASLCVRRIDAVEYLALGARLSLPIVLAPADGIAAASRYLVPIPADVPVRVPLDVIAGEDGVVYVQCEVGVLSSGVTCSVVGWVEFELPRTVNAVEIASPPARVAKDEP